MTTDPHGLVAELEKRTQHRQKLIDALPTTGIGARVNIGGSQKTLAEVVAGWRGHDAVHGEDIRLALETENSGAS